MLDWFEADPVRVDRLVPLYSHGALEHEGCSAPRAITRDNLRRLRGLGGTIGLGIGPPFYPGIESLREGVETIAALPFRGRPGFEGIALGTDLLGVDETAPGLGNAPEIVETITRSFDPGIASALLRENAEALLGRAVGL